MQMFQSHKFTPEMQQQLNDSLELLKIILGSDLLGVYLYGSSLVRGLQKYSDIDAFWQNIRGDIKKFLQKNEVR